MLLGHPVWCSMCVGGILGYPVIPVLHVCMESLDHHNGACAV